MKAAVFLCDLTGNMAQPWAEAGYQCWCVDIQHPIRNDRRAGNINFVWGDVRSWCPPEGIDIAFVAAFPPCTDVASSGARDWRRKGQSKLIDALELFTACQVSCAWSGAPYLIENPIGALSAHMGQPDHMFHPCDYAGYLTEPASDAYTKKTCLWTGNGFVMPERKPVPPDLGSKMHRMSPGDQRANLRSATPMGFARAVFLANSQAIQTRAAA